MLTRTTTFSINIIEKPKESSCSGIHDRISTHHHHHHQQHHHPKCLNRAVHRIGCVSSCPLHPSCPVMRPAPHPCPQSDSSSRVHVSTWVSLQQDNCLVPHYKIQIQLYYLTFHCSKRRTSTRWKVRELWDKGQLAKKVMVYSSKKMEIIQRNGKTSWKV